MGDYELAKIGATIEQEFPDDETIDNINSHFDDLFVRILSGDMQIAYDLTSHARSVVLEPQFQKYLKKEEPNAENTE